MSTSALFVLFLVMVVVMVVIGYKTGINIGIVGLGFGYILAVIAGITPSAMIKTWPITLMFPMLTIPLFFAIPRFNGTIDKLARLLIYKCKNFMWLYPVIIFLITYCLTVCGASVPGTSPLIIGLAFGISIPAGIPHLPVAFAIFCGTFGQHGPWTTMGRYVTATLAEYFDIAMAEAIQLRFCITFGLLGLVIVVVSSILLGGFKKRDFSDFQKPEPLNKDQKITIVLMLIVIASGVLPKILGLFISSPFTKFLSSYIDVQLVSVIATLIAFSLKLADHKTCIAKGIMWNMILMLCGVSMLLSVAKEAGVTDYMGQLLAGNLPVILVAPVFGIIGGLLSFFSGGMTVIFPMLAAIAVPMCEANPALNVTSILISVMVCASLTNISPFSQSGAMLVANCPDQKVSDYLFKKLMVIPFVLLAVGALLSVLGVFNMTI